MMMKKILSKKQKGFALLFTVLIITLVLNIAVGISTITFKQTILSTLARDSQSAFYQADAAVECGMYYDVTESMFPKGVVVSNEQVLGPDGSSVATALTCGDVGMFLDYSKSRNDYLVFERRNFSGNITPCFQLIFDKTDPIFSIVRGNGYNQCTFGPRQVQRTLQVKY